MPKNAEKSTKSQGRKAVKAERYRKLALSDDDATYGRVIKALGQRQFHIILPDASMRLIEVRATIPKKRAPISVDDIVVVAPSGSTYEIQTTMDRKTAAQLSKEKKLHPDLLIPGEWDSAKKVVAASNDVGIEFDYEGAAETKDEWSEDDGKDDDDKEDVNIDDI